ncbi:MAG: hypothetical protein IJM42_00610 [Synergistes sp.]|nr:hypothetical protein [Synergistes sp.]MCR5335168.1 hypothetical protein [Synergistes sp.]
MERRKVRLGDIAHVRTGDKGNVCNICVIPYNDADYPMLKKCLTAAKVKEWYGGICLGDVTRYEVDSVCGLNFVLENSLGGGVTRSLAMDKHGKAMGMALLEMELIG